MVKVGVIGCGRVAKSVVAFALDDGHEVVALAEHAQEYEYFANENLTVVDGSCVNAPDLERVVKGGVAALDHIRDSEGKIVKSFSTEGKIRRFISTESLSTVASRFSAGSRSGFVISRGSSGRSSPLQARSGIATPTASSFAVKRDKSEAAKSTASTATNLIVRGVSSCTGMPSGDLSMCSEEDYLKVIQKVQDIRKSEEEMAAQMSEKKPCDVVVLAVSDQRGSYKHELIHPALQVILSIEPAPKRVIVVTQNGCGTSLFVGNPLRQGVPYTQDLVAQAAKDVIEDDCFLGGGIWEVPTWKDLERADAFVCKKMRQLKKSDNSENETQFMLVRPNSMTRENNTMYSTNSRRDSYTASFSSGFMDNFVGGINTGDVGRFIADHLDDTKYDGKPVHLYRGAKSLKA